MDKLSPKDLVLERYKKSGWYSSLYAQLRWKYCPYDEMEALIPKEGIIVDFGCGEGLFAHFLAETSLGRNVIGFDSNLKRINKAKKAGYSIKNLSFLHADIVQENIPNKIHGAIFTDFLHHLSYENQEKLLSKILPCIVPNGILLIKEVGNDSVPVFLWARFLDFVLYPSDSIRYRSSQEWVKLLEKFKLKSTFFDTKVKTFIPNRLYLGLRA